MSSLRIASLTSKGWGAQGQWRLMRWRSLMNLQSSSVPGLADASGPAPGSFRMSVIARGPLFFATPISSFFPASVMIRSASWRAPRSWSANDQRWASGSWAIRVSRDSSAGSIRKSLLLRATLAAARARARRAPPCRAGCGRRRVLRRKSRFRGRRISGRRPLPRYSSAFASAPGPFFLGAPCLRPLPSSGRR